MQCTGQQYHEGWCPIFQRRVKYADVCAKDALNTRLSMDEDLKPFRQFRWLLQPDENTMINKLIQKTANSQMTIIKQHAISDVLKKDDPTDMKAIADVSAMQKTGSSWCRPKEVCEAGAWN